ncbi:MAG TPA: hypothetical protein VJ948_07300 [Acidimicrobiia bacterium]|nr:hypothetical protein [Acidimicrobiia bacterium]
MTDPHHQEQEDLKTPFSFKLMVVLVVLYLGWRLVQGVVWVWQQVT